MVKDTPDAPSLEAVQALVNETCDELATMLVSKNESYGNSIFKPIGVFSREGTVLQGINRRIDDKLQRLKSGKEFGGENTISDLAGYLVMHMVATKLGYS